MTVPVDTETVFETKARDLDGEGVTVIVTLYNYQAFIRNALDSVFRQKHSNIELVVVDDGSQDNSKAAAKEWLEENGARFSQARLLSHIKNHGLAQARNTAFFAATNEFVFVLDADNEIHPEAIAKLLAACISSGAETAYSLLENFGNELGIRAGNGFWNPALFTTGNYIDAMALIRKSAWLAAGGYSYFEIPGWEDYDLWCKFVEHGFRGTFVPELLCRYRVHTSSMLHVTTNRKLGQLVPEMMKRHSWLRLNERGEPRKELNPARIAHTKIAVGNMSRPFYYRPASTDVAVLKQIFVERAYDLRSHRRFQELAVFAEMQQKKGAASVDRRCWSKHRCVCAFLFGWVSRWTGICN